MVDTRKYLKLPRIDGVFETKEIAIESVQEYIINNVSHFYDGESILIRFKNEFGKILSAHVIVNIDENEEEHLFEGEIRGTIIENMAGTNGFGYDPIFVPEGYDKTFAQLSSEIKNTISHRARAMEKFLSYFNNK